MMKLAWSRFHGSVAIFVKPILAGNVKAIASEESDQAAPPESSFVKNGRTHFPCVHSRAFFSLRFAPFRSTHAITVHYPRKSISTRPLANFQLRHLIVNFLSSSTIPRFSTINISFRFFSLFISMDLLDGVSTFEKCKPQRVI